MTPRSILTVLVLASTLTGCGAVQSGSPVAPTDTGTESNSSGTYGYLPGDDGSDDGTETDTGSGVDTDSGTDTNVDTDLGTIDTAADDLKVTAKAWIYPNAVYDVSSPNYGHSIPSICMFDVVVDDVYPEGYGSCVATSSVNAYMADPSVEYVPGAALVFQAKWNDSIRDRYFAEYGGVVNAVDLRVVLEFPDGTWQGYTITGAADAEGEAGWEPNGDNTGGQVVVYTWGDTTDHHDR